jgi:hypothetical protein
MVLPDISGDEWGLGVGKAFRERVVGNSKWLVDGVLGLQRQAGKFIRVLTRSIEGASWVRGSTGASHFRLLVPRFCRIGVGLRGGRMLTVCQRKILRQSLIPALKQQDRGTPILRDPTCKHLVST